MCGATLSLWMGNMVNPADILCNECILSLWDERGDPTQGRRLTARLVSRMGMTPELLSRMILRKLENLADMVTTREELVSLLERRNTLAG